MNAAIWVIVAALPLTAQSLRVYSDLARIDSTGEVTAPAQPREILSPAIVRNGFTSFQIVVQVKSGTPYWLYVGENPDNAVKVTLYREAGDRLERVGSPYQGDSTQIFWLDLFADRNAMVRRIKIEPELDVNYDWVTYPMEVRVMEATVPDIAAAPVSMMKFLCGRSDEPAGSDVSKLRLRNQQQDVALASKVAKEELLRRMGVCDAEHPEDREFYLRIRDYLFRMR